MLLHMLIIVALMVASDSSLEPHSYGHYPPAKVARHMLGLQQVNFSGGPGKQRQRKGSNYATT